MTINNACHRSVNAYPVLVAKKLGLDLGLQPDDPTQDPADFVACSGAVLADLWNTGTEDWTDNEPPNSRRSAIRRRDCPMAPLTPM